ncbi:response regulator [Flagellimonas flava]|uniref:Response regulator receiver domain-containing protein n=1 Tax=Flagellimonas flava TaxID=570519 RepID=A0A1M5PFL5_9FLAO|nr:response regulator [Allomuricauda flava]SHH00053.1 Response regulator receiver domain-containing protein [Allomuricauda flava]
MKKVNSIFIIDDDPITVFGIKKMLKTITTCRDITAFENGKLALEGIQNRLTEDVEVPEVIFLDINMPIMDGWEFLEELVSLNIKKRMIINVITSSIDPKDYRKWNEFRLRCIHYLNFKNKPLYKIEETDLSRINLAS